MVAPRIEAKEGVPIQDEHQDISIDYLPKPSVVYTKNTGIQVLQNRRPAPAKSINIRTTNRPNPTYRPFRPSYASLDAKFKAVVEDVSALPKVSQSW